MEPLRARCCRSKEDVVARTLVNERGREIMAWFRGTTLAGCLSRAGAQQGAVQAERRLCQTEQLEHHRRKVSFAPKPHPSN